MRRKTGLGVFIVVCWGACSLTAGTVAFYVAPDGRAARAVRRVTKDGAVLD